MMASPKTLLFLFTGFGLLAGCGGSPKAARTASAGAAPPSPPGVVGQCGRAAPGVGAARYGAARAGSSVALALWPGPGPEDQRVVAYVADSDDAALYTVDVTSGKTLARTKLRGQPEQLLVLADGRVAAALRDKNAVEVLEPNARPELALSPRCLAAVPSEPVALAATPDDKTLLVTSGWGRALTALNGTTMAAGRSVELPREPRSVVASDDGKLAYVAHVVGAQMSVVDLDDPSGEARQIDLRAAERGGVATSKKGGGEKAREGCQGFALAKSSDGARVFAPMALVDPGEPARASSGGYGNPSAPLPPEVSAVAVVDANAERSLTKALFAPTPFSKRFGRAQANKGDCILPRAAAYHDGSLFVTCFGVDSLVEYDGKAVDPSRFERRRWAVGGGPTGVAIDAAAGRAVVWSQFDHVVSVVPLRGGDAPQTAFVGSPSARPDLDYEFALGRELFHRSGDARISQDGRACASCHPNGREDAITWATPDGPRQTPMLAGRLEVSAPYSWSGTHATLSDHVHVTFQRLGGTGLDEAALGALLTYIGRMPVPTPSAPSPARLALVDRGRDVFASSEASCVGCHGDPDRASTDRQRHDVGSFVQGDGQRAFDTPSLRFLSGTAPYFHDGRYATLDALLDATDSTMGHTAHLSKRDRKALAAYLETL